MRVFYQGSGSRGHKPRALGREQNVLVLTSNNWDDYGVKTTFDADLYFDGEKLDFSFHVKILIENSDYTSLTLDSLLSSGWDGFFPIPDKNYVSLPSDIEFYSIIVSKLGLEDSRRFLEILSDAGLFKNVLNDHSIVQLLESEGFKYSILRESGAMKAYENGWFIFNETTADVEINDFELNILSREGETIPVPFRFNSNMLPYDINVLVGPNGVGKSHAIKSLTEYWLKTASGDPKELERKGHEPFSQYPNFSNLILVSYSPFEDFKLDLDQDEDLNDKNAYKYFGFRRLDEERDSEVVDRDLPSFNSAESVVKAVYDDEKFGFISDWVNKLELMLETLKLGFNIDYVALKVKDASQLGRYQMAVREIDGASYFPLFSDTAEILEKSKLLAACDLKGGVTFIYQDTLCSLSSGQKLFSYIVLNVLGELRKNSLVVVDEPELFLHPTLEIAFVSLLKKVLVPFNSKAILATHSPSVVREVPSNCVHVFVSDDFGLDVIKPSFQTFGCDIQRISSYVFGDKSVNKPFDDWLEDAVQKSGPQYVLDNLKNEINEELTMKIMRLGRKYGF